MSEDYEVLYQTIKRRRKRSLLTQQQVADAIGMSKGEISRIENGRHRPYLNTVKKIAGVLGASPEEFIVWVDSGENGNGHNAAGGSTYPDGARTEEHRDAVLDREKELRARQEAEGEKDGPRFGGNRT